MTRTQGPDRSNPGNGFSLLDPNLDRLLENLANGILLTDRAGEIVFCNSSAEQTFETGRKELLHRPFPDPRWRFNPPLDLTPVLRHGRSFARSPIELITARGSRKTLSLRISPLFTTDDQVEGALVDFHDDTRHKATEDERENLLAELHATIRAIADAVIIYKPNGEIVHMNPAAKRVLGYQESDLTKPIAERLAKFRIETPDGDSFPVEQTLRRMLAGESFTGLIAVMRKDKDRPVWFSLSGAPIFSSRGEVIAAVGTATDITALHCADEERSHCMQMLTHDLRSPLTVIHGHAQLLQTRLTSAPDEELQMHIHAILEASKHMNVMLRDLVEMARIEGGNFSRHKEPLPAEAFLKNFLDTHCLALDCDRIILAPPASAPTLLVNPNALERILLNLLSNALKYSPAERTVRLRLTAADRMAVFAVEDQGCGIAAEDIPLLFRRFVRLPGKSRADSLGLGLYIARLLVESQGGEISVTSTPGQGSTFSFTIPRLPD